MSIDEWIHKMWYLLILFSIKNERNTDTCYNMDELLRTSCSMIQASSEKTNTVLFYVDKVRRAVKSTS